MEKVATDIFSFRELREKGFTYVDKTAQLLPLCDLSIGKQFFIARPRRFGKSLLVSTLHCLFEGRRELFEGLAIEPKWDWSKSWPVIHLDMGTIETETVSEFRQAILDLLRSEAERLNVRPSEEKLPSSVFRRLVHLFVVSCATLSAAGLDLSGEWRLDYWPEPATGPVRALPLPQGLPVKTVAASVPGNCELDLVDAGILPPLESGLNVLKLRPYECYQWLYSRTFEAKAVPADGSKAELVFDGIDTLADVFLNGEKIGESANMLIPRRFDVTRRLREGTNVVQVLLRSVLMDFRTATVGEMGSVIEPGGDGERYRKAAHMGGWDILPRAFVQGLWRDVRLDGLAARAHPGAGLDRQAA